ncbi:hypothetical protein EG346_16875 [Chryseobacterium carnipullorum]|uniref:Uncharacterized protein n=1 Tax=Chryseobacterium carnipullorum TaxID=1124835 RepID=A0A376DVA9_CHRCU|nr:hypothetical protein [Chryseobacterium carnipullorum]AZA49750.1 hypothetical protein EG346_16875 [Chryseobacterium carnipullorum]AZA64641.1 hypothetical protein EG345_07900 [Chryseobacterium carnipullorum]STC95552.1 Uncharacterised protein [Chryseobacterium carnipullorum]
METKEIYRIAKQVGMSPDCKERMSSDLSIENLCQMYFDGDDWSMENDFPKVEVLRQFKGKSEVHGLFTDFVGMPNNLPKAAFFGKSNVQMIYNGFSVSQLVIRHETTATIKAAENAIVIINLLDDAELDIDCIETARVDVFSYGRGKIKYTGDVRIHKSSFKK